MSKGLPIAAGVLLCAARLAHSGQEGIGSMPIASVADLAAAAGIHRVDASTLPLDIVRIAFASPDGTSAEQTAVRAALTPVLRRTGSQRERLPLPLDAKLWTDRVLGGAVSDGSLAPAIFGSRRAALIYHALMGVEPATLAWIESNPALLDVLLKHPGVSAVYARSVRIKNGRVVTPGDAADDVWAAIVGVDPARPTAFVAALLSARSGRVAGLYDAVAHLDAAHQAFAIGKAGDADRVGRAQRLLDAVTKLEPRWRLEEHPFMRPDVDAAVLLRSVHVTAAGQLTPPGARDVWSRVFDGAHERGPIDAAWLAGKILAGGDSAAREHLETFLFGQRALGSGAAASEAGIVEALQGFSRYPALMLTLENHGLGAAAYAAAARAAAAMSGDDDAVAIFQSGLAIVDVARRSGTIDAVQARTAIAALVDAGASRESGGRLLAWVRTELLELFKRAVPGGEALDAEALVLAALAGPRPASGHAIVWEEQQFRADLSTPELRRLTAIRKRQDEPSLDRALAAATPRKLTGLVRSMSALVYASALGDPDGQPAGAGPVWRRHRLASVQGPVRSRRWRIAQEVFGGDGWHLTGSLLRLDVALASLTLRRLDSTEMPTPSLLGITDRRTLALSVAMIDPRLLTDEERDSAASALARGRARAATLRKDASDFDAVAGAAALSEWRRNAMRWTLAIDAARAIEGFTLLELFRLGGGDPRPSWGPAATPLDGCLCLRFPAVTDALPDVKRHATNFLAQLRPSDQVTVLGFNDNIFTLARRSTDQTVRARAIDRLAPWGGTALYDVIVHALGILGRQSGRRSLLVFSDGEDLSSRASSASVIQRAESSDATIYVIGQGRALKAPALQKLMRQLAEGSGGRAFFTKQDTKLESIFHEIVEDLRHQYLLGYPAPDNARNGEWHKIRVDVPGRGHQVRARLGYRLPRRNPQ